MSHELLLPLLEQAGLGEHLQHCFSRHCVDPWIDDIDRLNNTDFFGDV
jgi:hypothetical protein